MSPEGKSQVGKAVASNNLYTIILALAFFVVFATIFLVGYMCYIQYDTFFKIP
jgi:hypothetical protein